MTFFRKFREGLDFSGGFFRWIHEFPKDRSNLTKKHDFDAGLDLYACVSDTIQPGDRLLVPTGIEVEILPGYVGLVFARSGLAVKHGIMVGAGVIDAPYRGEVGVLLFNMGKEPFIVNHGDRIAQMLTIPLNLGTYDKVDFLSGTERGANGYGSSGK